MIIRTVLILLSAVVAAVVLAFAFELPKPKPIDPTNMIAVEVVAPREPVPVAGDIMDVGQLNTGYVHMGQRAAPVPVEEAPAVVERSEATKPPRAPESDPVYYDRYVRETVRQEPPRVYRPQVRPRVQRIDPDPYRDRPRTYYYDPNPRRGEPMPRTEEQNRQRGCNAMASWCENSRARNETRGRLPENRGEDFFE